MTDAPILFVSLGPGDPELITVRALRTLRAARVVFCPATPTDDGGNRSRAAELIEQLMLPTTVDVRRFVLPMLSDRTAAREAYLNVIHDIEDEADGTGICIACEGDAGFYSSIHYIYEELQRRGRRVELVAGVPAFIAAGARAGIHVACGRERLTVVPGTADADDMHRLLNEGHTIVIMKPSRAADAIRQLIKAHPEHDYHYMEQVGYADELCLDDPTAIAEAHFPYFSILIIRSRK